MDVCDQASSEPLRIAVKARIIQQAVLKQRSVELGAVPGPHYVFGEVSNRRNTSSEGGGGASRGGHGVGARKNVCMCVAVVVGINYMYPSTNGALFSGYTLCSAIY